MSTKAAALILLLCGCASEAPYYDDLRKLEKQKDLYEFNLKCQQARSEQKTTFGTQIYVRFRGRLHQCRG